jgi:hypothetical protein
VQVYGTTLKALIHEEFGDGIMSAIDFDLDLTRQPDPAGDRVKIVMTGKFLKYKKTRTKSSNSSWRLVPPARQFVSHRSASRAKPRHPRLVIPATAESNIHPVRSSLTRWCWFAIKPGNDKSY